VLSQFGEARQTAATALFRMAESYRKLGKNDQAMAAYGSVIQDFSDQGKLVEQSRSILSGTYHETRTEAVSNKAQDQARMAYRDTLVQEVRLNVKKLTDIENARALGQGNPQDVDNARIALLQVQRELAAFDAGLPQAAPVKK